MTDRLIKKTTIAVGYITHDDAVKAMNKVYNDLNTLGIKCTIYLKRHLIITTSVILKFISKGHYYRYSRNVYGIKCAGCYGFNDEESYNITKGKNICKGFELIEYISKMENIYEG